jgi:hypothetical protein
MFDHNQITEKITEKIIDLEFWVNIIYTGMIYRVIVSSVFILSHFRAQLAQNEDNGCKSVKQVANILGVK